MQNKIWDWMQVEVTSLCNANCNYCPHTVYKKNWANRHLEMEIFKKLISHLDKIKLIYFQGWGEPFLNPKLFDMIEIAKKLGCRVGTTSNANLIDKELSERIVVSRIDNISFSLAGVDKDNDIHREGTSIERVLNAIDEINKAKKKLKINLPKINIAYLLFPSELGKIHNLPDLLKGRGIYQIVISTLDFIPTSKFENESLKFNNLNESYEFQKKIKKLIELGKDYGLEIYCNVPILTNKLKTCSENPERSFFLGSDGSVSPCVFTNLPLILNSTDDNKNYNKLVFGNIEEDDLIKIWNSKEYKDFRASFEKELCNMPCKDCLKRYIFPIETTFDSTFVSIPIS
ncbi:Radical SAM domain protein [Thermodesulfobium narugense DSM 14796]|uniref:Radical SAM domain protein n=1 Tax=Thermodesulfobium narugense DSM 14796 TaxID=747365 RepID=M1E5X9_9BACT|nr:radical SAM protein [Thermodesulfobium narugense]AEE14546.1 Radical SAM domain protein [Thermodesulfobium narugense DSM 14796]